MAIGSIINLGGGGGSLSGKGMIIVDTNTMTVGDKVRVRSVYDVSVTEDKTVATVGTPLYFQVEPYDYYKICIVQTISDVETEIGGEYTTIDVGQTVLATALDKKTLGGVQGILNAHQESSQLAIGDEVDIIVNGNPWTMQIAGINVYHDHDVMLTSKHIWTKTTAHFDYTALGYARSECQNFYSDMDSIDSRYIKEVTRACRQTDGTTKTYDDYCFVLGNKETMSEGAYGYVDSQVRMPLFVTQANRIKTYEGVAEAYWTSDDYNTTSGVIAVNSSGAIALQISGQAGVVPSFMLIADS